MSVHHIYNMAIVVSRRSNTVPDYTFNLASKSDWEIYVGIQREDTLPLVAGEQSFY